MRKITFSGILNLYMAAAVTAAAVFTVPLKVYATEPEEVSQENENILEQEIESGTLTRIDLEMIGDDAEYAFVYDENILTLSDLQYDEENEVFYIEAQTEEETEVIILRDEEEFLRLLLHPVVSEEPDEIQELPSETALDEYVASEEKYEAANSSVAVTIMYGTAYADGAPVTSAQVGTTLTIEADEDTEDRKFVRWNDGETERTRTYEVTDTLTLEAVFSEKHSISVKDSSASAKMAFAGDTVTVTAAEKPGYVFESWQTDDDLEYTSDGNSITFTMPDHDVTVNAVIRMLNGTWAKQDGKWTYKFETGESPAGEWALINNRYYLFDEDGYMLTGWQKDKGSWYYLHESGAMAKGWENIGGKWYFLNRSSGKMAVGWVYDGGKWFWMNSAGAMTTGWQEIKDKWYYMNGSGVMQKGWLKSSGKWYYLKDSGEMAVGWVKVKNLWYYMNSSGAMLTGWQKIKNKWYFLNSSGAMITGWRKVSGKWYYLDSSGAMATGWKKIGNKWYLMDSSGVMLTGWQASKGKWYYLNKAGDMVTGWKRLKGEYYYMDENGVMATGTQTIDGKTFQFKTNGALKTGGFSDLKILFVDKSMMPQWKNLYNLFGKLGPKMYFLNTSDFNVDDYDALVLGGGGDVEPSLYGESNQGSRNVDVNEDKLQMAAIKKFVEAGKPVFGVCRGEQVLNVYFGGTLIQDRSGHMGGYRAVSTAEGSLFEGVMPNGYSAYHSHHQCVKDLGSGLWATAYDTKDGTIEGFEHKSLPVFGVQYHPEAMGNCNDILNTFLKVVRAYKQGVSVK